MYRRLKCACKVFNLISALTGAALVDKLGRRTIFIASNAGMLITFSAWTLTTALFNTIHSTHAAKGGRLCIGHSPSRRFTYCRLLHQRPSLSSSYSISSTTWPTLQCSYHIPWRYCHSGTLFTSYLPVTQHSRCTQHPREGVRFHGTCLKRFVEEPDLTI